MIALELLINHIAAEYGVPDWLARGIAWGESGGCWGNPPTAPCWIATEPDGAHSVGPYQIHDIHGLSLQWRQDFENNTRWAMENSVGPAYRGAVAAGITDRAAILAYVWRYGQRCAESAIQPAVHRAMLYLEGSNEMPKLDDWHARRWPSGLLRQAAGHFHAAAALCDHAWTQSEYDELLAEILKGNHKLQMAREVLRDNGLGPETGDKRINTL
jgi:hypothetical protein